MSASTFPQIHRYYEAGVGVHHDVSIENTVDNNYYNFLSQNLNNSASSLITEGKYEEAILHLTKALHLTKLNLSGKQDNRKPCSCKFCSLETCLMIVQEQEQEQEQEIMAQQHPASKINNKKRPSICSISSDMDFDGMDFDDMDFVDDDDRGDDDDDVGDNRHWSHPQLEQHQQSHVVEKSEHYGFVYRRPLLVNQHSIDMGHYMGVTLSLIIMFNTALAHHLKAIHTPAYDIKNRFAALQQALQLYELAYQLHADYIEKHPFCNNDNNSNYDQNLVNLRLTMLVMNNLSEIHRIAGNSTKHELCLQHLLSSMMYMSHHCNVVVLSPKEIDGFYHNVSPIMMTQVCAAVA